MIYPSRIAIVENILDVLEGRRKMFDATRWPGAPPRLGTPDAPLRLGILISGRGTNMLSIITNQQKPGCCHHTKVVISDNDNAKGLAIARENGILSQSIEPPTLANKKSNQIARELFPELRWHRPIDITSLARRITHEIAIDECLRSFNVEFIILAGYMRLFSPWFIRRNVGRLINIHPSILPDYPGPHAVRDALDAKASMSGCTIHHVDEGMDSGPIIAQAPITIEPEDTETTLLSRIQIQEHLLYPAVLDAIATQTKIAFVKGLPNLIIP